MQFVAFGKLAKKFVRATISKLAAVTTIDNYDSYRPYKGTHTPNKEFHYKTKPQRPSKQESSISNYLTTMRYKMEVTATSFAPASLTATLSQSEQEPF